MKFRLIESTLIETKQDIENFISKFGQETYDLFNKSRDRLKNNGYSTDLIYYTKNIDKEELDNILSKLQRKLKISKSRNNYNVDKEGIRGKYNYLGEKNGYKIYQPLDYLASVDLGYMTGWCTTGRYSHEGEKDCKPSETEAKKHFESYTSRGIEFYYFLDSKSMEGIYAVAKYPKVIEINKLISSNLYIVSTNFEIYNQADKLDYNAILKIPIEHVKGLKIEKFNVKDHLIIENNILIKVLGYRKKYTIPSNVQGIASKAFFNKRNLTDIIFEENSQLKYIGDDAFMDCDKLVNIVLPNSVTNIEARAFGWCKSLTNINIPENITNIADRTFCACNRITEITIPNSVTSIGDSAFYYCKGLTSITIPNRVTSIGNSAFYECSSLTSVTIPNSVTSIGSYAFSWCSSLTDIYYAGTEAQWKNIRIDDTNGDLFKATIHYNSLKENMKENKMQFKILKENTDEYLLDKVNELLKPLKIHVSMPINIDKNGNVWLFAYSRQQSERWEEKLKAAGYNAFAFFEQGAYIVKVNLPINKDTQDLTESVDWSYYNKFNSINDKYLPDSGEGENMATQIVTAVNKLIYKWYNDGDVYDNRYGLEGWANDLSSYANWLHSYVPETKSILERVIEPPFVNDDSYENLIRDLADLVLSEKFLSKYESQAIKDSIYEADGPFEFVEYSEDDEDDYDYNYEDDYDEDYLDESLGLKEKSKEENINQNIQEAIDETPFDKESRFTIFEVITDREYEEGDLHEDEIKIRGVSETFDGALEILEEILSEEKEGVIRDNESNDFISKQEIDDWYMSNQNVDDYLDESIENKKLTEDTHLINSYYMVDVDNEIIADNATRQEARDIVNEVKDTFNDYIYVTKTSIYDTSFGRQTDYEDIVDVNRFNDGLTITKDVFKIFNVNEALEKAQTEEIISEDINWQNINLLRNDTSVDYIDYPLPKESDFQNLKNRIKHNANTFYYLYIDIDDVNNAENYVYPAVAYTYIGEDDNGDMADMYGVVTADILSTGEIIEDGWYDLNSLEFDLLDIIKDNLPSINEYKINIGELNIKNSDQKLIEESVESYIYLFPELTYEDKEQLDNYNLTLLGKNRFEDEVNSVVKGSKEDLELYAKDYLDYELHPDYLYVESDFAGEIESDMFEDFNIEGDVDFSVETPNKLTIEDVKEIAMEHYEDGGDAVIETMTDEDIQNWIEQDGTRDGLMNIFRDNLSIYQDRKAREYDDYHYEPEIEVSETEEDIVEPGEIIDDPLLPDEFEYDDDISDFGPGNPWDAPGMSVKDFLR